MDKKSYCNLQTTPPSASYFYIKRIVEAVLFSTNEPLTLQTMHTLIYEEYPISLKELKNLILELKEEYKLSHRAFQLQSCGEEGWILTTIEEYSPWVSALFQEKRSEKLSPAAIEVLAIIAYKQPITRPAVDAIRGVDSSSIIQNLVERDLVKIVGKQQTPGRPSLYATSDAFMNHFGITSINDLPTLETGQNSEKLC